MMHTTPKSKVDTLDLTDVVEEPVPQPNRDPITGTRGAHPVGVGVGAATAGAVGGVIGSAIPVVGTAIGVAVGTAVGAVVGGFAGKGAAEALFPTEEAEYWRKQHDDDHAEVAPYTFDQDYLAAYRFGYINAYAYDGRTFDEVDTELQRAWDDSRDASRLTWPDARKPARRAWDKARVNQKRATELDSNHS